MGNLKKLQDRIYATDNTLCFVEREVILDQLEQEMAQYAGKDKYAKVLAELLGRVSVPIYPEDFFAGRVVEGPLPEGKIWCNTLLFAEGHTSLDYGKVIKCGLKGVLMDIRKAAENKKDEESECFAQSAEIVVQAIRQYCLRYAEEAQRLGYIEMAEALKIVPFEPAYDFFSALQGIWMIHMIASCYVGARDYAFGNFDQYMYPFYKISIEEGKTEEELTELLAGFYVKMNEIGGTRNHDAPKPKPVLSQASNQYLCLGGETPNPFSNVCLKAAELNHMPQPVLTIKWKQDADALFTEQVFRSMKKISDCINIYNYELVKEYLVSIGIEKEIAKDFTYTGCCFLDLEYHTPRHEYYVPTVHIFKKVLHEKNYDTLEELVSVYMDAVEADICKYGLVEDQDKENMRRRGVLESLLLTDTALQCKHGFDPDRPYHVINLYLSGIATIGDSLMVLDKLVFREKRYSYEEFRDILTQNYQNHEELLREIQQYEFFGNDGSSDTYAVLAGNAFVEMINHIETPDNVYLIPGFYSLHRDNVLRKEIGATPNGRKSGEPFSENQSPTYGADKKGITALVKSVAKLPFAKAAAGGLNVTLSGKVSADILKALVGSYFQQGGLHMGISVIDRTTLKDAMVHPDQYKSLTVRLYGFSNYFVNLSEWQQVAVLNRTEYNQQV